MNGPPAEWLNAVRAKHQEPCANPACPREWHGFPVPWVNDYWQACAGSWTFEAGPNPRP